ncbi:hypothetical protein [Streptomyces sp. NPDC047108]|uniref:hypothetical protein n=1 Tax=Streptomyces sp. NPDC047108 TaxID=3155025 RepID=UPI0033EADA18
MTPRHLPAVALLAACTAVLLSGCGGSDDTKPNDGEVGKAGKESAALPTSSTQDGAKRPRITLPKDDIQIFEGRQTGDPKKDAVLADNEQRLRAIDAAIIKGDPDYEPVYFYSKDDAAVSAGKRIQWLVDKGYSVTGTIRFSKRDVTFRENGSARLTYCSDESKAFAKGRETKKIKKTPATKNAYIFYDTSLKRNKQGVWQTTTVISDEGAQQCQP